jgi:hypothetical protein
MPWFECIVQNKSPRVLILYNARGPGHNPTSSIEQESFFYPSIFPNVGNIWGTTWEQLGNMSGTYWEHIGNQWERVGNQWEHLGNMWGTCGNSKGT